MAISFILLANSLSAQCNNDRAGSQPAQGVVFADINGNGRRETNETGIAGVALSNGCDVVISDGDGRYEISIAPTEIIFLSKPANYSVPVDEFNVPQFFSGIIQTEYQHKLPAHRWNGCGLSQRQRVRYQHLSTFLLYPRNRILNFSLMDSLTRKPVMKPGRTWLGKIWLIL